MTPTEYLNAILDQQTFAEDDPEMVDLRRHRTEIRELLLSRYSDPSPSIRWAGSVVKRTLIRDSYDGDVTCYFDRDDAQAGDTLEAIHASVRDTLREKYMVEEKASALRVMSNEAGTKGKYLHIDVVPGRFVDGHDGDVFLHRTTGDKARLKTNLDIHIAHIRDSGVRPAIRLNKLWRFQNGLSNVKTFVLELLVIKLLSEKKHASIEDQLVHVWTEFRDHPNDLSVQDPANPAGNDLKPALDECRYALSLVAERTLKILSDHGWEAVFGPVESKTKTEKAAALSATVRSVSTPSKPWLTR